jgi:hypothetical protein
MSTLQDSDLFVVDRNQTNYQVRSDEMSTLEDTDLFVVERAGVNYKIEAKDVSIGNTGSIEEPVSVLTPLNGAGLNDGEPYQPLSTAITAVNAGGDVVYATDTIADVSSVPAWNQSKAWSSNYTGTFYGGYGAQNAFNGVLWNNSNDYYTSVSNPGTDGYITVFDPPITGEKIEVIYTRSGAQSVGLINGTEELPMTNTNPQDGINAWARFEINGTTLSSITMTHDSAGSTYFNGVYVDGKLLVDPGISGDPGAGTLLTFPTSNNFDKFKVGDVVQTDKTFYEFDWASLVTGTNYPNYAPPLSFDNSTGTFSFSSSGSSLIFSPTQFANAKKVTITYKIGSTGSSANASYLRVNGVDVNDVFVSNGLVERTFDVTGVGLNSIEWYATSDALYCGLMKIEVDGRTLVQPGTAGGTGSDYSITAIDDTVPGITVDGGLWLGSNGSGETGDFRYQPDQDYIANTTYTSQNGGVGGVEAVFSTDPDSYIQLMSRQNYGTDSFYVEFDPPIAGMYLDATIVAQNGVEGSQGTWNINDGEYSGSFTDYNDRKSVKLVENDVLVYKIACSSGSTPKSYPGFYVYNMFAGNSLRLVNSTHPGGLPGATDITKTVSSDASLTFTDDTELANMVGPLTMVDENGDVKTPVTSEIASVASSAYAANTNLIGYALGAGSPANLYDGLMGPGNQYAWGTGGVQPPSTFPLEKRLEIPVPINAGDTVKITIVHTQSNFFVSRDGTTLDKTLPAVNSEYEADISDVFATQGTTGWCVGSGNNANMSRIRVNGVIVRDNNNVALTFNTPNPDLQLFQPGDQIGTSSGFAPVTYSGNGTVTTGFSPDLVWIKCRNVSQSHSLFDSVSGPLMQLQTDTPGTQQSIAGTLTSFNSDGFTVGTNGGVGKPDRDYVAWCWDAGDTTVTIPASEGGSDVDCIVRANQETGFCIVKVDTPTATTARAHGLGKTPDLIIAKSTAAADTWHTWWSALGADYYINLNTNERPAGPGADAFGTGLHTDELFFVKPANGSGANKSGGMIYYLWAETPGVSSFGKYTGTGAGGNTPIECGFKPAFLLIKGISTSNQWYTFDLARNPDGNFAKFLNPNASGVEGDAGILFRATETGFYCDTTNGEVNTLNNEYIYAAFAGPNPINIVDVDVANNTMTVDGGDWHGTNDWNQSQDFIGTGTQSGTVVGSYDWDGVFNSGDITSLSPVNCMATQSSSKFIFGAPVAVNSTVTIWNSNDGSTATVTLNEGLTDETVAASPVSLSTVGYPISFTGNLQSVKIALNSPSSSNYGYIAGIQVDGATLVNSGVAPTGQTRVTGQPLVATANDVDYQDGNTLGVSGVSGEWFPGLHAQGAEVTSYAPSPESIVFTSMNGGTTPFTGTDASLTSRTWTLEKGNSAIGPWTEVGTYLDFAATESQDGASPWDNPALEPNKFYQVKVKYDSNNADSVESTFNTFKTGDA